ncbi:hypothetical protein [Bacillus sp. FJAT-29814]|uniref:hypothetical protein n=1 Tax=Bacillus sp. FJAT-29814 TaxID=1729688 RepID=UPI000835AB87|nr:hypothetical protein [Bacillus sp. FJAT-29814]
MKKMIYLLLAASLLSGCAKDESKPVNQEVEKPKEKQIEAKKEEPVITIKNLDGVVEFLANNGFTVGTRDKMLFTMIGATDGDGVILNDQKVEMYEFSSPDDASSKLETMTNQLDGAGEIVVNGKFMMVVYNDHSAKDKLLETFKNFK